jgi:hypothetical protein
VVLIPAKPSASSGASRVGRSVGECGTAIARHREADVGRHPGELLTRSELGERMWGDIADMSNLVDVHVCHLRKKIDQSPFHSLIQTVWGTAII